MTSPKFHYLPPYYSLGVPHLKVPIDSRFEAEFKLFMFRIKKIAGLVLTLCGPHSRSYRSHGGLISDIIFKKLRSLIEVTFYPF